jgi:hypothetical protein
MDSKAEVKRLLKESGNEQLFNDTNYSIATQLTQMVERTDKMLRQHFKNLEGQREQYKHDLIVKNCK